MSQRAFIYSLASLVLAFVAFVFWTIAAGGRDRSPSEASSSKASPSRTENEQSETQNCRFLGLTDKTVPWQVRVDQLRRLDATSLNRKEIDYLYALLSQPIPGGNSEHWFVVVNEIIEQIVKQGIAPERICEALSDVIQDKSIDPVIRDYAVQHLANYLGRSDSPNSTAHAAYSMDSANAAIASLESAILDPDNQYQTIVGTTLMGLLEIRKNPALTNRVDDSFANLENHLQGIIEGSVPASLANQTSAINVIGLLGNPRNLPQLRQIVESDSGNASVRLSSIAAMGDMYNQSTSENRADFPDKEYDMTQLERLASSSNKFSYAAKAALKKFRN